MNNMDEKEDAIDPDLVKSILSSGSFGSFGFSPAFGLLGAMLMSKKKTNEMKTDIEIPFGAKDSELKGWEYTIPEGMEAIVKDGKVIVKEKESEDERIRQTLFDYFSKYSHICMWGNFTRDQIVAYLEKQKEQKPIIKGWVARDKALQLNFYTNKPKRGKTYWIENGGDSVQIMPDPEHLYEEQNFDTLDWKDEPIEVELVVRASTEKRQEHVPENEETGTRQEQKPAEKQDYSGLNDLERAINRGFLAAGVENVPVTIIKETAKEFLAQMKPAEWSEEDEDFINMLILHFNYLIDKGGDSVETYKSYREKLKSLRPSWKPSEEEMDALKETISQDCTVCNGDRKWIKPNLESLYEQLKVL